MSERPVDTLRAWIRNEVVAVLRRKANPPPLLLWCDAHRAWRDLLKAAAEGDAFELWAEEKHELVLREELMRAEARPRVVWLPKAPDEITYLKVFELQAEHVLSESLVAALARFGVEIPSDRAHDLRELLPAHAKEWIDRPRSEWKDLTVSTAKVTLVDDDRILEVLASPSTAFVDIIGSERVPVLARRSTEEFGLPAPAPGKDDEWRVAATAHLLVTHATAQVPNQPPSDADRLIAAGPRRERALRLLGRWLDSSSLAPAFEKLARDADGTTTLMHWARNLAAPCPALASPAAEGELFKSEVAALETLDEFDGLARRLEEREGFYAMHAGGFWGARAEERVPWDSLVALARAAALMRRESTAEREWKTPSDAVAWFASAGWEVDHQGEVLFRDFRGFPAALHPIRARLRRAYLCHVDRTNRVFSELLHQHTFDSLGLPFAGKTLAEVRPQREPMAVLVLDACRFDLGKRLEERLNRGEPKRRAEVCTARAPLPSITALGMPFALADEPDALMVELTSGAPVRWRVTARGFTGDLTVLQARRDWITRRFKLKGAATRWVKEILDDKLPVPKEVGRLLVIFGDEFDKQGHEDELSFTGADDLLDRYTRALGRLREAGWSTVAVVTDHGFIHWDPEPDEFIKQPEGEVLWRSRRAVVGRNLKHPTAIKTTVPQSDLECHVPRSIGAFETYGGIGFFHGGATLQELVIPVVVARWPKKAEKVPVVLTRLAEIASLRPRIEIKPGGTMDLFGGASADEKTLGRQVMVKIVEQTTGRRLFASIENVKIEPSGPPVAVALDHAAGQLCPRGTVLRVEVRDADNDELLDHCEVELKVDIEEWD